MTKSLPDREKDGMAVLPPPHPSPPQYNGAVIPRETKWNEESL